MREGVASTGLLGLLAATAMLAWVAFGNAEEDKAAPFRAVRADSAREAGALSSLMTEAWTVLRSPELQDNLRALQARYPAVYANSGQQEMTPSRVADFVALRPFGSRFVKADVILVGGQGARDAGFFHASAGQGPGEGRYSDVVLGRFVLAHYGSEDLVRRSCAINVAAHEYAHTISVTPFLYRPAFTDSRLGEFQIRGRRDRSTPVASYLIGAAAQCTWLQQQGRIGARDVPACVEVFGVASGNDARCGAFGPGEPIRPHPRLPPLSPPL